MEVFKITIDYYFVCFFWEFTNSNWNEGGLSPSFFQLPLVNKISKDYAHTA